jgi:HAD superfamily hydrolase (TIGR01459 family)
VFFQRGSSMSQPSDTKPPLIEGLSAIADNYDGLLVDLWGCLHNGMTAYGDAVDALQRFRAQGGRVTLLSNAPRREDAVASQIAGFGVPDDAWDAIMTAGIAVRLEMEERGDPWFAELGRRFYHIGTEKDAGLLDGLDYERSGMEDADFVLCCGIRRGGETLEDVMPELDAALARGLPLVSANPDRFVLRGPKREICAGTMALAYQEKGGAIRQEGKPYPAVYRRCQSLMAGIDARRILAIGDGIETDIAGGRDNGIDTLWITGGLPASFWNVPPHEAPPQERVFAACREHDVLPSAILPLLCW